MHLSILFAADSSREESFVYDWMVPAASREPRTGHTPLSDKHTLCSEPLNRSRWSCDYTCIRTFVKTLQEHGCIILPHVERKLLLCKHKFRRPILAGRNSLSMMRLSPSCSHAHLPFLYTITCKRDDPFDQLGSVSPYCYSL